jgi:hypothetical protein
MRWTNIALFNAIDCTGFELGDGGSEGRSGDQTKLPKKAGVTVKTYCLQYVYTAQYLGKKDKQQEK